VRLRLRLLMGLGLRLVLRRGLELVLKRLCEQALIGFGAGGRADGLRNGPTALCQARLFIHGALKS
jgi:hypothetical protein